MEKVTYLITYENVCALKIAGKKATNLFSLVKCRWSSLHKCYATTWVVVLQIILGEHNYSSLGSVSQKWSMIFRFDVYVEKYSFSWTTEKFHLHEYLIEWLIRNSLQQSNFNAFIKPIREYSFITLGLFVRERFFHFTLSVWYPFTLKVIQIKSKPPDKKDEYDHAIFIEYSVVCCEKFN